MHLSHSVSDADVERLKQVEDEAFAEYVEAVRYNGRLQGFVAALILVAVLMLLFAF